MDAKTVDPFTELIGQPVPTVDPEELKEMWDCCNKVWQVQRPRVERPRLDRIAAIYRFQILTAVLRGRKPDELATQALANLPLVWPDMQFEDKLMRTPVLHVSPWLRMYRFAWDCFRNREGSN